MTDEKETAITAPSSSTFNMGLETPSSEKETAVATSSDEESAQPATPPSSSKPVRSITGLRWLLVCFALYVGTFIYGLDTTIAADVQGAVVEKFGHVEQLAWIGAGFPVGSVVVITLWGKLYGTFNMKWNFAAAMVLFQAGSALCGAAPTMTALIVGRVVAGAGGAGIFMGTLQYFTALSLPKERGTYLSGTAFWWGIGAVLGPLVGGGFTQSSATWRWAFYINLVLGGVFAPVYVFGLPDVHPVVGKTVMERIKTFDYVGLVLGAAAWVTYTMGFTMAGGQWPWNDGRTIATLVVFGVLTVLYLSQQTFCWFTTPENRSLPVHLFRSRTQILLALSTLSCIASLFVLTYFIPIYFQFVHGDSAVDAAVRLLPFVIITVSFNLASGHFLSRIQYYMPMYVISGVIVSLGSALLTAYLDPSTPTSYIYGFTVLTGAGTGLTIQIGFAVASLKCDPKDQGNALSIQNIFQVGGQAVWLVIAGQVFQSTAIRNLTQVLAGTNFTEADIRAAIAGAQSVIFEEITGDLRAQAILAITKAMQRTFILVCAGGGGMIVTGLFMKREKLFGEIIVTGA
ncbi:efflux pump patC [Trichoderma asperellum]|uniref:Efflux pump patC n=1 Tax=Trichoderma asperellum TaxID=101201 RepID=A0A6V8R952_TRIAP|nr:MFS general substrate transporter [Trichoderma asperelloides]GFP59143.1 efflux pump patC [Trichoderma asperellum]